MSDAREETEFIAEQLLTQVEGAMRLSIELGDFDTMQRWIPVRNELKNLAPPPDLAGMMEAERKKRE